MFDYVKQQVELGADKQKVTEILIKNGWNLEDIIDAFALAEISIKEEKHLENISNNLENKTF